jgi:hypothetical protein
MPFYVRHAPKKQDVAQIRVRMSLHANLSKTKPPPLGDGNRREGFGTPLKRVNLTCFSDRLTQLPNFATALDVREIGLDKRASFR